MSSLVTFDAIDKEWLPISRGQFEAILGGAYELYLDRNKAPRIAEDLAPQVLGFLYDGWPSKYELPDGKALDFFEFSEYPREERIELFRAMEAYYADFQRDQLDPGLTWMRERKEIFTPAFEEVIALMREELAATS
ncbi:hypothetical protein IYW40_04910 [Methylocystis sp. H4A]|jgi:hypothetical protein|uniref:hypothetical protein n=1 Tax=Methylocystis sp. H4A TaxID=2785788 RepID=UPI0018C340D1|nr:hypothetical protein [Methylocystis sp. H4A]MBG0800831.1 hypothetical protein [Methylocystis sp. H4A]